MRIAITTVSAVGFSTLLAAAELPPGFVRLADVDPTIIQEIRYAGSDNFVGRPIPGYGAADCWLRKEVARALSAASNDLAAEGYGLVVYDCYRPVRAVRYFERWALEGRDEVQKSRYYPEFRKADLIPMGFIARASAHPKGTAVDVGLIRRNATGSEAMPDMGTRYDFFGSLANTDNPTVAGAARQNRAILRRALSRRGLSNYPREWWHYSMPIRDARQAYDLPITP